MELQGPDLVVLPHDPGLGFRSPSLDPSLGDLSSERLPGGGTLPGCHESGGSGFVFLGPGFASSGKQPVWRVKGGLGVACFWVFAAESPKDLQRTSPQPWGAETGRASLDLHF